jgi:hypothetical protein
MIVVGAQKGVLVCPSGFSKAAKNRAEGLQIDLYSPVDTDPHKWQAKPLIPALCDFRSARMSFAFAATAPLPFMLPIDFYASNMVFDAQGNELGTMLATAMKKWNDGCFPTDVGVHDTLPIFDAAEVLTDNDYGMRAPIHLSVSLYVERTLYYGMFPIQRMSGFKDELRGGIITNAFTVGILSPEEIERDWKLIEHEADAQLRPVITLTGLVGWADE